MKSDLIDINKPINLGSHLSQIEYGRILPGEYADLRLAEIVDLSTLQKLQDSFAEAGDVASIIIDTQGRPVTRPSNFNEVCRLIKQTDEGVRRCDLSDADRNALTRGQKKPVYHQCTSCGFVDASAPIYIGNRHVADWLIGQCNALNIGRERITEYAAEIGADARAMLEAYDKLPKMTLQKFQRLLYLLHGVAAEISNLCYNNLQLANEIRHREESERKLELSEDRYQELFNSVMEGICIVDEHDRIKFANPALARMFNLESTDHLIDRCIFDVVGENQIGLLRKERKYREDGHASQYELQVKNERQEMVNILISAAPRYDENGRYKGSFATIVDITEKKRLEEFTSRAQRLEFAGRIAAQVAHDFNNLLGPLVAYPDLIRKHLPQESPAGTFLDDIATAANMMTDINQQLLTLGRRGQYNQEIVDLNELIRQSLNGLKLKLSEIRLDLNLSRDLMNIKGGMSQISRVISNLVHNALDAMHGGGRLMIKTENYYLDGASGDYGKIPKGEYVKLTIADTGQGIPEVNMPYIFDPFYTTKSADKKRGSGLGLSVVHAVMEDHDGFVDVASKPGRGTSAFLYFPINRESTRPVENVTIVGGNEKVLVIDDDMMQREVTSNLLKKLGYRVSSAECCDEALEIIRSNPHDLVILDLVMPGQTDGTEIYGKILELYPSQKAIIVSGLAESERISKALAMGAGAFVKKPLTLKSLALAVRHELNKCQ